jgi:uncharacterized protein
MTRVLITGGSGFIGKGLIEALIRRGDEVTVLTRDVAGASGKLPRGARAAAWDPERAGPWFEEVARAQAILHLAGASVATRWTPENKREIERSRVVSTRLLVEAIGLAADKPEVLVSASAVGYYGAHPKHEALDESAPPGHDFLAEVCVKWEAEARAVEAYGVRAAQVRIGVVLGEGGGALEKMVPAFKLFAGGPLGDGRQPVPWIHYADVVGILLLVLDARDAPEARGPINAVAPDAATAKDLSDALGAALHRPSWLPVPSFALKALMGEAAMIVTQGQHVVPRRAQELGYRFAYPSLGPALTSIVGRAR